MNTFLPYQSFRKSAACLDNLRLNKQIVEARQIYNILTGQQKSKGWINHPCTKMWIGYEDALNLYIRWLNTERYNRGKTNIHKSVENLPLPKTSALFPNWLGTEEFHSSHRSALLLKGEIDRIRKRLKILGLHPKNLRDATLQEIENYDILCNTNQIPDFVNYYNQFNWSEKPERNYIWPI